MMALPEKSYLFRSVVQTSDQHWLVSSPALEKYETVGWGDALDEAYGDFREKVQTIVEELSGKGELISQDPELSHSSITNPLLSIQ